MARKILKAAGIFITILVSLVYLVASVAGYFPPAKFPWLTLFSTFYLPVLIVFVFIVVTWFFVRRKTGLLLLLLLLPGFKALFSTVGLHVFRPSWQWKKEPGTVRIMCWNINRMGSAYLNADTPGSRRRAALAFIEKVNPDILCLQDFAQDERLVDGRDYFVNNINSVIAAGGFTGYHYLYHFEYNGPSYCDMIGPAIFSRFPITDTGSFHKNGALPMERFGFADILIAGKKLRVFSTHLSSMSLWPNTGEESGIRYLEGDSTRIKAKNIFSRIIQFGQYHAREAEVVRQVVQQSPLPVLFSADLNSVPGGYVYRRVKGDLNDAFLQNDFGIGGTYNRVFPKLRIDVLFHSDSIDILQYTRPATDLSDHYPIIADFKWKE
ncbi:MAG TPA: endonuclease/exonuclease/phosphatase family protein [Chitinophagaceae bacterium]